MTQIDTTSSPSLFAAYKGSGGYLVALRDGAEPIIERLLSPKMRRTYVVGRRYRGELTASTRAAIRAAHVKALADFDGQVAAFEAKHGEALYGFGSCTVVHVADKNSDCALSVSDGEDESFWRLRDRKRVAA